MQYEQEMYVIYDVLTKGVMVSLRGQEHTLPGPLPNQREAIKAAEAFCVDLGQTVLVNRTTPASRKFS